MLEVFVNFLCAFMLALVGYKIINNFAKYNNKFSLKTLLIIIINSLLIAIIHFMNYSFISLLLNFIINTMTYKIIFKNSIEASIIQTSILTMYLLIFDTLFIIIQIFIIPLNVFQNNLLIYLLYNILVSILVYSVNKIKFISAKMSSFYIILSKKDLKLNSVFIIMVMITVCGILYSFIINNKFNLRFYSDIFVVTSLIAIVIIFINNKETYHKLANEYDILLSNVSTFEDWIEKEQFTRHEYKNQLAVLYALSSEKEVKNKIQEIINQNLNIKNEVVNNLKDLPKGGLKGLLYYKTIIAEKNKLNITVDVSIKENGLLKKLNKNQITTLAKIVGILYDNAIDAAKDSKKKIILLEIYELKNSINIVISNTYKKTSILNNRFEKGVSSKGKGHGNGLYYLSKILKDNSWIEEKQEIIDNYYIETIIIKKSTSKK